MGTLGPAGHAVEVVVVVALCVDAAVLGLVWWRRRRSPTSAGGSRRRGTAGGVRVGRLVAGRRRSAPGPYVVPGRSVRPLDGMRALAVLTVLTYHLSGGGDTGSWDPLTPTGGFLGVDVFFVLSGFLITSLLLEEVDRTGRVGLRTFYGRRARRLLPALALTIVAALALVPVMDGTAVGRLTNHYTLTALPAVVLYVGNWRQALGLSPSLGLFSQTWSLSVEEQYYLVFPLLLVVLTRVLRRRLAVAVALLVAAAGVTVWLVHLTAGGVPLIRTYDGSDTHSGGLLLGAALAVALAVPQVRAALAGHRVRLALRLGGAAGLLTLLWLVHWAVLERSRERVSLPVADLATAAVVLAVVAGGPGLLARALGSRPLVWVGRRSYGLYLYGWVAQLALVGVSGSGQTSLAPLLAAASILAAALSYRYVEVPILRGGKRRVVVAGPAGTPARVTEEVAVPAIALDGGAGDVGAPTVRRIRLAGGRSLVDVA